MTFYSLLQKCKNYPFLLWSLMTLYSPLQKCKNYHFMLWSLMTLYAPLQKCKTYHFWLRSLMTLYSLTEMQKLPFFVQSLWPFLLSFTEMQKLQFFDEVPNDPWALWCMYDFKTLPPKLSEMSTFFFVQSLMPLDPSWMGMYELCNGLVTHNSKTRGGGKRNFKQNLFCLKKILQQNKMFSFNTNISFVYEYIQISLYKLYIFGVN